MKIREILVNEEDPITNYIPIINKKDINGILFLISNIDSRFLEHKLDSNLLSISQTMAYSLFGQNRWRTIRKDKNHIFHKLFEIKLSGNSFQKITNGYKVTEYLISCYSKFLDKNNQSFGKFIDIDKTVYVSKMIPFRDELNNSDYDFMESINIDLTETEKYINGIVNKFKEKKPITIEEFKNALQMMDIYYNVEKNNNKLDIYYKKSNAGRTYSVGRNGIQFLKKKLRKHLLSDYIEYDISTSAPLILSQIYQNITGEKTPKSIAIFIKNKKRIREIFSEKHGITIDESKTFFTSLFFGAKIKDNYYCAVTKILAINKVKRILKNEGSYEYILYKDIQHLFQTIYTHFKKLDNKKVTYCGNTINFAKTSQVVAHIYQSAESDILLKMVDFYIRNTLDTNYVRLHDCIYTKKVINCSDMYFFIKEKTKFDTLFKDPLKKQQLSDTKIYELFEMTDLVA